MVILGEFLAVSAVIMCMLHIFVDLGQPRRVLNVLLHPAPQSVMFWDMVVLTGYLLLNLVIGWTTLDCERNGSPAARLDQAADLPLDSLGRQHPHGHGVPLLRPARAALLDDGPAGPALPGLGVRFRPGPAHPPLPDLEEDSRFDAGAEALRSCPSRSPTRWSRTCSSSCWSSSPPSTAACRVIGTTCSISSSALRGTRGWFPGCGRPWPWRPRPSRSC